MLTNVISHFTVKKYGVLELISWKYTFKRLNEEYDIAKRKKQALDNLYETGKISQATRESFSADINAAILEIEKQQRELIDRMQVKTQELESQIKTLEALLANYEIQHVVGEIDEEIYQREISLLTTGLETTRKELDTIKQAVNQLNPTKPALETPSAPETAVPSIETEPAKPEPAEITTLDVPIDTTPVETAVETPPESPPVEASPAEIPIETMTDASPIEEAPAENITLEANPVADTSAPLETAPVESAPLETATVVFSPAEETPEETIQITSPEPEVQVLDEPTPEIVLQEPTVTEPTPQEPAMDVEEAASETVSVIEQPVADTQTIIASTDVISEVTEEQQPTVDVPLQVFEVTEHVPIDTTLEKVIDPVAEPVVESVVTEEDVLPVHPSEAPQGAHTETQNAEVVAETDESSEENTD
jgi:hypothetical protein